MSLKKLFTSLWHYRAFIKANVATELASKYKNSILGFTWAILNPLAMILIYTIVFSQIMKAKLPGTSSSYSYSIYLCIGIITWGLFSEITSRSINMYIENANLLKKTHFPKACLPAIISSVAIINFLVILGLFISFLVISQQFPGIVILHMVPVLLIQLLLSLSLGQILAIFNVFFRDTGQLFTILLQFWFWATPIVYPITILPEKLKDLTLTYNPMTPIITAYHDIFVFNQAPNYSTLFIPIVSVVVFSLYAIYLTKRNIDNIIDEL